MDDKEVSDSPDKAVTVVDKDLDKIEVTSSATENKVAECGDSGKVIDSDDIAKVTESDAISKVTESGNIAKVIESAESITETDDINSDIKCSSNVNIETLSDVQNSVDHEIQKERSDESYETLKTTVADKVDSIEPVKKHEIPESKDSENATKITTAPEDTLKEEPSVNETSEEKELKTETVTETIAESGSPENNDKETISKPQNTPREEQNSENKDEDDDRTDDRKPEFETAPNCSIDEQQEDHTQALDPFDALLKDRTDTATETETATQSTVAVTIEEEDDDDHNADQSLCDIGHDDDIEDDHPPDDDSITEIVEQPGADEEVCLLPDTEREISEADKAAAEKVLAEKRKQDEAAQAAESAVPKEEAETTETAEAAESISEEPAVAEDASESVDAHVSTEDVSQENGGDKENENEEVTEPESNQSNTIQQISSVDATCSFCKTERSCQYRYNAKDGGYNYLCELNCVNFFQDINPGQYLLVNKKYIVEEIAPRILTCSECEEKKCCYFYYNFDGEDTHYCSLECLHSMMADEKDCYTLKRRWITVVEKLPKEGTCCVCNETKDCIYSLSRYGISEVICEQACLRELNLKENGRYLLKNRRATRNQSQSKTTRPNPPLLKLKVISNATDKYLDEAYKIQAKTPAMVQAAREERERTFMRVCVNCHLLVTDEEKMLTWEAMDYCNEECLWKYQKKFGSKCSNCKKCVQNASLGKYCVRFGCVIRQFCNSACLEEFKKGLKICCYCQKHISSEHMGVLAPVGDKGQFKDFCSQICMEKFDHMSKNPVPQPVWAKCAVCSLKKATTIEVEVRKDSYLNITKRLCSDPCFAAFKFVNNIFPDQCRWCKKYFERKLSFFFTIYEASVPHCFCSKSCMNIYISNSRHIVPCNWCKVKKYNFDMIRRAQPNGQAIMMCSLNCLNLYQVSVNAVSSRRIECDMCKVTALAQYHLTMSDATVRNFCTYQCVMTFQSQYSKQVPPVVPGESIEQPKAVPTGAPRRTYSANTHKNNDSIIAESEISLSIDQEPKTAAQRMKEYRARKKKEISITNRKRRKTDAERAQEYRARKKAKLQSTALKNQQRSGLPVISNVQSLAPPPPLVATTTTRAKSKRHQPVEPEPVQAPKSPPPPPKPATPPPPPPPKIYNHVIVKTLPPHEVANKATMSKPMMVSKGVSCRPHPCTKECQTDPSLERRVLIPVPVPIYVPVPCVMWSLPFPVPVPIPIPIPTPVFIPTTRNSAKGIMKEINKIHDKMPTDPIEAEILMMAEMVAGDKKKDQSDSDTEDDNEEGFSPVGGMDGNNAFGEDMLQMALKMATEYEDQPVDLESAMTANTITPSSHPGMPGLEGEGMHQHHMIMLEQQRAVAALRAGAGAGAVAAGAVGAAGAAGRKRAVAPPPGPRARQSKRRREPAPAPPPDPPREPQEKPDANMCLKYTFGVNAWKQWVMTKNAEIEKSSIRRKPFKSEILQLTADELNYSLCLFVKEVRKPNGSEYAPDTIYYLVLGIQQYLFENGRIDNIFTDPYYEKFTDCLDEVARKFSVLYNDSQYIVTRVEEEHLWESKQLGAHSPHVLLSTLMFFNTKHFNLVTVDEHMQLSFSHIMKHWKRNPNQPGQAKIPGSRNVLLRFYPPQSALEANSRKKKVYEQQENEENPLRCPVKLYEFYISKCPESVRTRNDVFYLQPERSCVPDSPVWYSTQPLSRAALAKMLHRVKMVKEINIALLTS